MEKQTKTIKGHFLRMNNSNYPTNTEKDVKGHEQSGNINLQQQGDTTTHNNQIGKVSTVGDGVLGKGLLPALLVKT